MDWDKVREVAMAFEPVIREKWPAYLEEMTGIATGANVPLSDILALNVRTEIAFGLFSDGCTALYWLTAEGQSFLAQNWDWMEEQKPNLLSLDLHQRGFPDISMITEAGIIGKIGFNSNGVGVCLNAIKTKGVDYSRLPCHLALRKVLESASREKAVEALARDGVASACHMLIADGTGGVGVEWSSIGHRLLPMDEQRQIFHSNHYLLQHDGVEEADWLPDSKTRIERIRELGRALTQETAVGKADIKAVLLDAQNAPEAIYREQRPPSKAATLFTIVMELQKRSAEVILGKPGSGEDAFELGMYGS